MSTETQQWRLALDAEYESRRDVWSDVQDHLPFLHDLACRPGARVLELGVRWGTTTAALLAGVEQGRGHLWSVDLEPPTVPSWWRFTGRWTLTIGDDLHPDVLAQQPTGVDVLFLDTSHTYDHTLAELETYVRRMVPGGVVCCHDTRLVGHDDAGMGIEGENGPVRRALDTYTARHGLTWTERPGSFGLGVIEIPTLRTRGATHA